MIPVAIANTLIQSEDKRKKKKKEDDGVVVVTDFRTLSERLHDKIEESAGKRKRKGESSSDDQHTPKRSKKDKSKKNKKKDANNSNNSSFENGTGSKHTPEKHTITSDSEDDLEGENEVIHIDDYYDEIIGRAESEDQDSSSNVDSDRYEEDIRLKLLGIKRPESVMSPVLLPSPPYLSPTTTFNNTFYAQSTQRPSIAVQCYTFELIYGVFLGVGRRPTIRHV